MSFFNHWSEALKPKQATEHAPQAAKTDSPQSASGKFKNLSVHRFGNHVSIYAQDPSGQVKVYYRDLPRS